MADEKSARAGRSSARENGESGGAAGAAPLDWPLIFEQYRSRLLRVAYLITGDPAEAEDAVQGTFVKGIGKAGSFKRQAEVYTWLYRILVNHCLDQLRHRNRYRELPETHPAAGGGLHGPENSLLREEAREAVRREVLRLEPKHRTAIVLRHYEELSYEEIGRIVGCPVGTVRSRLATAREILRARLEPMLKRRNLT